MDRDKGGFLIAKGCKTRTKKSGWETTTELIAEKSERFEMATDAFARWLEIAG